MIVVEGNSCPLPSMKTLPLQLYFDRAESLQNREQYLEYWDEMTLNFDDLEVWNAEKDLHGKNAPEVLANVERALQTLEEQGADMTWELPNDWEKARYLQWGHDPKYDSVSTRNLPDAERRSVLAWHLRDHKELASQYDERHFFFLDTLLE